MVQKTVLLVCLSLLIFGGCVTTTPKTDLLFAQNIFLRTVNSLTILRESGQFDDGEIDKIKILIKTGDTILDDWTDAVLEGKDPPNTISIFETVLTELIKYRREAEDG